MDTFERDELITRYQDGYRVISDALMNITDAEMDAREAPGEWSPRQVVHHLADSETASALRPRSLLVEDNPTIRGYDQDAYAARLWYDRPIEASLAAFRAARETTAQLLVRLDEADWSRTGTHTESGPYSCLDWLRIYAAHAHDHAGQIERARATAQ